MTTDRLNWFKSSYSSSSDGDCVEVALTWHKSSHSSGGDGDCVEVARAWRKSSHSSASGDDCVEISTTPHTVHVRDSKDKTGPRLALSPAAWDGFLTRLRG
ncbi:DUF397 domain-containing protein [Streptomyces sp. NPDC090994]|uniref:DUF397 domain-containing protein n=1 Tax=Streptomyces sp. NPDC090994 TaxID=3365969 RepID=UPI00380A4753